MQIFSEGLGAVLFQKQEGMERVTAYASCGLRIGKKNYSAHELEFLSFEWAVTDKFHDYLYGNSFLVMTDNNPLTYVLSSGKLLLQVTDGLQPLALTIFS